MYNLEAANDEELVDLVEHGSPKESRHALGIIYTEYHKDVWRFIRSRVFSDTDTDDLFADVWFIVTKKIHHFVWTGAPIKSWLISIAKNKIFEFNRQSALLSYEHLEDAFNEEADEIPHDRTNEFYSSVTEFLQDPPPSVETEKHKTLHRVLVNLPTKQFEILKLIYFDGIETLKEVAKKLGMNESTVRVYKKRAEQKLRELKERLST